MDLKNILKNSKSSEEVEKAIEKAEEEHTTSLEKLEKLKAKRTNALVDADDKTLDKIEEDLNAMYRHVDRMEVLIKGLNNKLEETVEAERIERLDKVYAQSMECQKRCTEIAKEYVKHAEAIAKLMPEYREKFAQINNNHYILQQGNYGKRVDYINEKFKDKKQSEYLGNTGYFYQKLVLPDPRTNMNYIYQN